MIQQLKPHTHTEKQTATSVAFWCILMALSQRSDARCRQYSAVATLKVWSRDLWSCPQVLSHRAPCSEGLVLRLRLCCGCLEIVNNFWTRDFSLLPANYVAGLSCLKPFHGIREFRTILYSDDDDNFTILFAFSTIFLTQLCTQWSFPEAIWIGALVHQIECRSRYENPAIYSEARC